MVGALFPLHSERKFGEKMVAEPSEKPQAKQLQISTQVQDH
jgi:hypothetical protein